uniref:Membrane-associated protein n=1 Tax=Globodera rostochiensis TaxID=31243 RepID=A0A914HGJ9_GLORO
MDIVTVPPTRCAAVCSKSRKMAANSPECSLGRRNFVRRVVVFAVLSICLLPIVPSAGDDTTGTAFTTAMPTSTPLYNQTVISQQNGSDNDPSRTARAADNATAVDAGSGGANGTAEDAMSTTIDWWSSMGTQSPLAQRDSPSANSSVSNSSAAMTAVSSSSSPNSTSLSSDNSTTTKNDAVPCFLHLFTLLIALFVNPVKIASFSKKSFLEMVTNESKQRTPPTEFLLNDATPLFVDANHRLSYALVGQLPTECEKMAKSNKMEKHRFVHAVMALANAGGVPGERMKTSHKAPLDPSEWERSRSLELDGFGLISRPAVVDGKGWDSFGSSQVDEDARRRRRRVDPIEEAVKVLRDTTAMLGQMLNDWRAGEGPPGNGEEDDDAIWPSRHRKGSATASPTTALDTEAPALFARLSPMPTAQTEKDFEVETRPCRTHGTPLSAIISFPSELRRYRMMEGPWEEIPEGATQ